MLSFLKRYMSERGEKEGNRQGLSNMRDVLLQLHQWKETALPLVQAVAVRICGYCKMVLANPLRAEEASCLGMRNTNTDPTTSTEGFYTGINILVMEK